MGPDIVTPVRRASTTFVSSSDTLSALCSGSRRDTLASDCGVGSSR